MSKDVEFFESRSGDRLERTNFCRRFAALVLAYAAGWYWWFVASNDHAIARRQQCQQQVVVRVRVPAMLREGFAVLDADRLAS